MASEPAQTSSTRAETGSGKSTLSRLLVQIAKAADRIVLIETPRELQCAAPNLVITRAKDTVVSLSHLNCSLLRLRPTAVRSARCAVPKSWTYPKPEATDIPTESARSTPDIAWRSAPDGAAHSEGRRDGLVPASRPAQSPRVR